MLPNDANTAQRIKHLLIEKLNIEGLTPDSIDDAMPLFGEGPGLDSVDALELVVAIEKEFNIRIQSHEIGQEVFASVATLADYVDGRLATAGESHASR
jgi:acyl carrier protein